MAGIQKHKNATTLSYQNLTFLNFFFKHSFGCFTFFIRLQCFEKTDLSVSANLMVSSFYLLKEAPGETLPFSTISSFFLQIKCGEIDRAQLLRLCHKRHWDVLILSWSTCSKRSQLPDCGDSRTTCGESHMASCWDSLPTVIRVSYLGTAVLVKPSDDYSSDQHLNCNLRRDSESKSSN